MSSVFSSGHNLCIKLSDGNFASRVAWSVNIGRVISINLKQDRYDNIYLGAPGFPPSENCAGGTIVWKTTSTDGVVNSLYNRTGKIRRAYDGSFVFGARRQLRDFIIAPPSHPDEIFISPRRVYDVSARSRLTLARLI